MRGGTDYPACKWAERKLLVGHICPFCHVENADGDDQVEWICGECGESYKLSRLDKLEAIKELLK